MNSDRKCNVYTLNGEILLSYFNNNVKNSSYVFDMDSAIVSGNIVSDFEEYNENPLFYQLKQCLKEENKDFIDNQNSIKEYILFIDFKEVFNKSDDALLKKVKLIFDGDENTFIENNVGINIAFNNVSHRFVPYDKSNSMSKESKISFIREDIKDKLDERLLIGFKNYIIKKIKLEHSKYLSYKGLYLSDSKRVNSDAFLNLDENKVIIINEKNKKFDCKDRYNQYTFEHYGKDAKLPKDRKNIDVVLDSNNKEIGEYFVSNEQVIISNSYDGEGFISIDYANKINEALNLQNDTSSYQIRLPFTKGVLHKVDFKKFYRNKIQGTSKNNNVIYVKDAFGIDRDINKVEIILTTSMFKCSRWLEEIVKLNNNADIVKDYFDGYRKYNHCLYLVQTDNNIKGDGKERLTYQFLSAMDIDKQAFKELNNKQLSYIDSKYIRKTIKESNEDKTWLQAAELNSGFYNDPTVKAIETSEASKYVFDIAEGRYLINGESRFLAGDLLALLIHIYENSIRVNERNVFDIEKTDTTFNNLKNEQIYVSHFYMPVPKIDLKQNKYYAIFRSPHLSRLEECIAKPYISDSKNNIYDEYFSHLKGVLMVAHNSLLPSLLGGADFDGDHVCIYDDPLIVEAVRKGNYNEESKRLSPVIQIPSSQATKKPFEHIDYNIIEHTFSSSVGLISNSSIKGAVLEYGQRNKDSFKNYCEKCTITTGLEIDAAKHGKHPKHLIDDLVNKLPKNTDSYIDIKKKFDNYNKISNIKKIDENKKRICFNNDFSQKESAYIAYKNPNDVDNNLMSIPYYFSEAYKKYNNLDLHEQTTKLFKKDNVLLDDVKLNKVKQLIFAYNYILRLKTTANKLKQQINDDNSLSCAYIKLGEAFGEYEYKLKNDNTVNVEFHALIDDLNECFLTDDGNPCFNEKQLYPRIRKISKIYENLKNNCSFDMILDYKKQIIDLLSNNNTYYDLLLPLDINNLLIFAKYIFGYYMNKKDDLVKDIIFDKSKQKGTDNTYIHNMQPILDAYIDCKVTSNEFNSKIKKMCLDSLNDIFDNDLSLTPYYIYGQKAQTSKFFWDVLPKDIILNEVFGD